MIALPKNRCHPRPDRGSIDSRFRGNDKRRGQVYIGVIVAMGIFFILSQTIVSLVFSIYDFVIYNRSRTTARHIAEQQMEEIHNVPYDDVGTSGGVPSGVFVQEQTINQNGQNYNVKTTIVYVDDAFDGVAPADLLPTDYKRARVDVYWGGVQAQKQNIITLVTDIAPKGTETTVGGGTLSILVFDANGIPVPQASVHIVATATSPPVDLTQQTNDNGIIVLPGSPVCDSCYSITATKTGYSTERTYTTSEVTNPLKPPVSVIDGQLTEISFAIDQFASFTLHSVGSRADGFPALGGQVVRVHGEKTIGTDGLDNPVYKFDQDVVTDTGGSLSIDELEWDNYHLSVPGSSTESIAGTNPLNPISVNPAASVDAYVSLVPQTTNSLLLTFQDNSSSPIASVSATLSDEPTYIATASSGLAGDPDYGQIYFDDLSAQTYNLNATASGYLDFSGTSIVTGYTTENVILTNQ